MNVLIIGATGKTGAIVVERAVAAGQDAVIDTIGGKAPYRKTTLERSVAGAVVASMMANSARRLIVISSFGVGDSVDQASWFVKNVVLPTCRAVGA